MSRSCPAPEEGRDFIIARRERNWAIFGVRSKGKKKNAGEVKGSGIKKESTKPDGLKARFTLDDFSGMSLTMVRAHVSPARRQVGMNINHGKLLPRTRQAMAINPCNYPGDF